MDKDLFGNDIESVKDEKKDYYHFECKEDEHFIKWARDRMARGIFHNMPINDTIKNEIFEKPIYIQRGCDDKTKKEIIDIVNEMHQAGLDYE